MTYFSLWHYSYAVAHGWGHDSLNCARTHVQAQLFLPLLVWHGAVQLTETPRCLGADSGTVFGLQIAAELSVDVSVCEWQTPTPAPQPQPIATSSHMPFHMPRAACLMLLLLSQLCLGCLWPGYQCLVPPLRFEWLPASTRIRYT